MKTLDELSKKAQELKEKGLSTYQIADELKVQSDTVVWLLLHGKDGIKPRAGSGDSYDVYVNWNPIGSSVRRLTFIGQAMADMIREAIESGDIEEPDVVAGIETGAMTIALIVARSLEKPIAAIKPARIGEKKIAGAVNPSFSPVEGRKVLIVDTIVRMGETARAAIETLEGVKARPVGIAVLANKSGKEKIEGVPLRSLIELLPVARQ